MCNFLSFFFLTWVLNTDTLMKIILRALGVLTWPWVTALTNRIPVRRRTILFASFIIILTFRILTIHYSLPSCVRWHHHRHGGSCSPPHTVKVIYMFYHYHPNAETSVSVMELLDRTIFGDLRYESSVFCSSQESSDPPEIHH